MNLLHHSECVDTMITYNDNVSMACAKCEKHGLGLGRVSVAWVGVPQKGKCQGIILYLNNEWSP